MATSQSDKVITVADGEMPFSDPIESAPSRASSLDAVPPAQTAAAVSGIQAVTATTAGPNVLVATDGTGKITTGILPAARYAVSNSLTGVTGTTSDYSTAVVTLPEITLTGTRPVIVGFSGVIYAGGTNGSAGWSFLYDGGYLAPLSSSVGVNITYVYGSGYTFPTPASTYLVSPSRVSAGSHTFSLTINGRGVPWNLGSGADASFETDAIFYVYEL